MDRRNFLHSVLALSALPVAEPTVARIPEAESAACRGRRFGEANSATTRGLAQQQLIGLSTGLRDLDQMTNGLTGGSLVVVAGRPSLGKSLLAFQIADYIARVERRAAAIACADDGGATVAGRLISLRAGVWPWALVRVSRLDVDAQRRIQLAIAQTDTVPILLDDTPHLTAMEVADRASTFASERGVPLGIVVVDGIASLVGGGEQSAWDRVSAQLRAMSQRLQVPVVITARVSRGTI